MVQNFSRREVLKAGVVTLAGLAPNVIPIPVQAAQEQHAKRLILIWGDGGGPAGPDSFDPKNSPYVDSIYSSIPTAITGVHFTDQYPRLAAIADQMTIFRGRMNKDLNHSSAIAKVLQRDDKSGLHLAHRIANQDSSRRAVYAQMPHVIGEKGDTYRKHSYSVAKMSEAIWDEECCEYVPPPIAQPDPRINERRALLSSLEHYSRLNHTPDQNIQLYNESVQDAVQAVMAAMDGGLKLDQQDIDRYAGPNKPSPMTMAPLLARELVRKNLAGCVLVRMGYGMEYGGWDQHSRTEKRSSVMTGPFDHATAELMNDVIDGSLPNTVVTYTTEFGRTPKLNSSAGRDHWGSYTSLVMADRLRKGVVVGQTDQHGRAEGTLEDGVLGNDDFAELLWHTTTKELDIGATRKYPQGLFEIQS